jgi:hypothetical protein
MGNDRETNNQATARKQQQRSGEFYAVLAEML